MKWKYTESTSRGGTLVGCIWSSDRIPWLIKPPVPARQNIMMSGARVSCSGCWFWTCCPVTLWLVFVVHIQSEAIPSLPLTFFSFLPTDNCRSSSALLPSWNQCLNWSSSNHHPCTCSVLCGDKTLTGAEKHIGKCLRTCTRSNIISGNYSLVCVWNYKTNHGHWPGTVELRGLLSHELFLDPSLGLSIIWITCITAGKVTLFHRHYHAQLLWTLSPHSASVALPRKPYEPVMEPDSLLKSLPPQIMGGNESYLCTFLCDK